jgi:hypothetical protein
MYDIVKLLKARHLGEQNAVSEQPVQLCEKKVTCDINFCTSGYSGSGVCKFIAKQRNC